MISLRGFLYLFLVAIVHVSCTVTEPIKTGTRAFELKHYDKAISLLNDEVNKTGSSKEKSKLSYLLAKSYLSNGDHDNATSWFQKSFELGKNDLALKDWAYSLKTQESYKIAFEKFKELAKITNDPLLFEEAQKEQVACKLAFKWSEETNNTTIESLKWNTPNNDYSPYLKDEKLYYITDNSSEFKEIDNWTGRNYSDIISIQNNTKQLAFKEVNKEYHDGPFAISDDIFIITKCGYETFNDSVSNCYLYIQNGNSFDKIAFQKEQFNYRHPTLSQNGDTLFFSSDMTNGFGGYDLYFSIYKNNRWNTPVNLGIPINTKGNEVFPNIQADQLYFSSDYHEGMGGLDQFKINIRNSNGVENLKPPFNSSYDDFGLIYKESNSSNKSGYFTSNRNGGKGNDDIYYFETSLPKQLPVDTTEIVVPTAEFKIHLEVTVKEKQYKNNDPSQATIGFIELSNIEYEYNNKINIVDLSPISIELDENSTRTIKLFKKGYFNKEVETDTRFIDSKKLTKDTVLFKEVVLDRIYLDREIVLENIYYDLNKANIRKDATSSLNALAKLLLQNPTITIELSSHTDCRGSNGYNLDLSQRRAQSVVDYLVSKGISSDRMVAKGYGETFPTTFCECKKCLEEEHQLNRRTAFKVLKK